MLEAEKILGTIHLALGDNTGFGGVVAAPFHEDYVFYQPTVTPGHGGRYGRDHPGCGEAAGIIRQGLDSIYQAATI